MAQASGTQPRRPTALAAVWQGAGERFAIRAYPLHRPARGMVRLALRSSGICGTDVHIHEGKLPLPAGELVLGHEFIGEVDELGSGGVRDGLGGRLRPGDLAIACVALPCGSCFNCRRGEDSSCTQFGVTYLRNPERPPHFHGGFAECVYSPAANLVKLPRGVKPESAAAFPCAGPTAIRAFSYAGGTKKGELVVVQGTGPLGLFAVAWAAAHGCTVAVIGSGRNALRTRLARKLGAKLVIDYRKTKGPKRLERIRALARRLKRGDGADVVFEASGSPQAVPQGLGLLRTRGRYLVPGQYSDRGEVEIPPHLLTFRALRIIGSGQYNLKDVKAYLLFLARNPALQRIFADCVTHRHPVGNVDCAMADVAAGRAVKAVLVPQ